MVYSFQTVERFIGSVSEDSITDDSVIEESATLLLSVSLPHDARKAHDKVSANASIKEKNFILFSPLIYFYTLYNSRNNKSIAESIIIFYRSILKSIVTPSSSSFFDHSARYPELFSRFTVLSMVLKSGFISRKAPFIRGDFFFCAF